MSSLKDNPRLREFRPVNWRTLYAVVREPQLTHSWAASTILGQDDEAPPPAEAFPSFTGVANLERDSIALIGADARPVRQLSLVVRSVPDWDAHRTGWKEHVAKWGEPFRFFRPGTDSPADQELLEYLTSSYSRFEKKAPTAHVGFSAADWEIGTKDEWTIYLTIPLTVAQRTADDLREGMCKELRFSFELAACFADDEYAPPSVGVTIGIPQLGKVREGSLQGWVDTMSWSARTAPKDFLDTVDKDDAVTSQPQLPERPSASREQQHVDPDAAIRQLAGTVRGGFVAILVLMAISLFLR